MTLSARRAIPETTSGDPTYIPVSCHAFHPVAGYSNFPAEEIPLLVHVGPRLLNDRVHVTNIMGVTGKQTVFVTKQSMEGRGGERGGQYQEGVQ